jgi:hypothetical protein
MIKIFITITGFLFSTFAASLTLEEKIVQMRLNFEQKQVQNNTINRLQNEQKMIDAYVSIVAARRQCDKLGIDCTTGKAKESTQAKLLELEQERLLIDAYMGINQKRQNCKNRLIDCKTGAKITPKKRKKVVRKATIKLPKRPKLSGYFNDKALFFNSKNNIKQYSEGDMVGGYRIKKIYPNDRVEIEYGGKSAGFVE